VRNVVAMFDETVDLEAVVIDLAASLRKSRKRFHS